MSLLEKCLSSYPAKLRWATFGIPLVIFLFGGRLFIAQDLGRLSAMRTAGRGESGKSTLVLSIAALENSVKSYRSQLVDSEDITWVIDRLNAFSRETGISLTSVSPAKPEDLGQIEMVSFQVEAEGHYHELGEFISKIENSTPVIRVLKLQAKPSPRAGPAGNPLSITLALGVFRPTGELRSIFGQ